MGLAEPATLERRKACYLASCMARFQHPTVQGPKKGLPEWASLATTQRCT